MKRNCGFEILINTKSPIPIYEQIKRRIKLLILSGCLNEGDKLLSIRELSSKLKVNPNTIVKVYYQLENEGFIESKPGSMFVVKIDKKKATTQKKQLFKRETEEYIAKIVSIGFTPEDAIEEIKNNYLFGGKNDRGKKP